MKYGFLLLISITQDHFNLFEFLFFISEHIATTDIIRHNSCALYLKFNNYNCCARKTVSVRSFSVHTAESSPRKQLKIKENKINLE